MIERASSAPPAKASARRAHLFGRLQSPYAQQRADWFARWLEEELMGDLLEELRRGSEAPESTPSRDVEEALEALPTTEAKHGSLPSDRPASQRELSGRHRNGDEA